MAGVEEKAEAQGLAESEEGMKNNVGLEIRVKNTPVSVTLSGRGNIICMVRQLPKSQATRKAIKEEARSYHKCAPGRVFIREAKGGEG